MSELLTVSEAARWLKLSESFLNKARLTGSGPKFLRLSRSIRYRVEDLEAWAAQGVATSTAEYMALAPFPDAVVRAAVVAVEGDAFAASYLDLATWDPTIRTITPRTATAHRALIKFSLRKVFATLGVTIVERPTSQAPAAGGPSNGSPAPAAAVEASAAS